MNVYLDDVRMPPPGWQLVHKIEEVQALLLESKIEHLSLDHDLGNSYICSVCTETMNGNPEFDCFDWCKCDCHSAITPTGYDLVKWMTERDIWPMYKPLVHSANPVGAKRMREDIDRYWHPPRNT